LATVSGMRTTGNISQSTRKVDMAEQVLLLDPNEAPLCVLSRRLAKRATINPEYSWQEDDLEPRFDAVNNGAGYASGATSIVVDNGAYFAQHFHVLVTRTGEVMRVDSVASNTLTVTRGIGSTAAAIVDNDELFVIGHAQPEGDTSPVARSGNPVKSTNYTQIFRKSVEASETLLHSDQFTSPHDWPYQRRKAAIEHNKDIELSLWFGKPSEAGSPPRRTTGGVFHFATSNILNAGGAFTEAELYQALRPAFRYGSNTKVAFGSMLVIDVMNGFTRGKLEVTQNETTYGIRVMTYVSPHGTIRLVSHPLFEGTVYSGYLAILDLADAGVKWRYLANSRGSRDTMLLTNRQANDADAEKDEYLTEGGLQFGESKKHAIVTGITS
jgi:hypothetical protein